jgi:transposase
MEYCGMDVHKKYSRVCELNEDGDILEEAKLPTTKPAIQRRFKDKEPMQIVLETGTESAWIARCLENAGHEVTVAHARRIKLITDNDSKNDRNDAETLARLGRSDLELLTEAHVRGQGAQRIRAMLKARRRLVESRTKLANQIRGLARQANCQLPSGKPEQLERIINETDVPEALEVSIRPLAESITALTERIDELTAKLKKVANQLDTVDQLTDICGVGWQTALCFVVTIENPGRFSSSKKVGAYFGLVPEVNNSGNEDSDTNNTGSITKHGDSMMRYLLVQAGHAVMNSRSDSELKQFAERIKAKKTSQVAAVACARKLAVLMHTLWVTGREYDPFYHQNQQT